MKRVLLAVGVVFPLLVAAIAMAAREPPAEVPVVRHGGMEFRVRHGTRDGYLPGLVEAWDVAANRRVWFRQAYTICYDVELEGDVQDVFITGTRVIADRNVLEVTNEIGGVFEIDLKTLEVKTVKGASVIKIE